MIVDDHTDGRVMLRKLLELVVHKVDEAADGISGVERILEFRPTIALALPGMDGYEVARAVR